MAEAAPEKKLNVRRIVIYLLILVLIILLATGVLSITSIWNTVLLRPTLNFLILMSRYFLGSFGIAIMVLTIIIRLLTYPLTMRQLGSSRAMQDLQPKLKELRKTYAKDDQKLNQEVMKLYKQGGVNPFGCFIPFLLQFPIWVALYQSVVQALAYTPENLVGLSKQLYSPWLLQNTVPLNHHFLGLDLTRGNIFMALLTALSLWVFQKMSSRPVTDSQQQSTNRVLLWGLPLLFGFFAFTLPSGLSLYWVVSNIIGSIIQYRITGWGTLKWPSLSSLKRSITQPVRKPQAKTKGTTGAARKVVKGIAPKQGGAKPGSASPEKKKAAGGDVSSQVKKTGPPEPGDKRKD